MTHRTDASSSWEYAIVRMHHTPPPLRSFWLASTMPSGTGTRVRAQVGELRLVLVRLVVEDHVDLVDDLVASRRADLVLDHLRIGAVDVVVLDHVADLVHPAVDDLLVVDGAVLAEQVLEHIGRHRVVALDQ